MEEACFYHPEIHSVINCFQCTKFLCESCRKFSYGYIYCTTCFEASKCKNQFNTVDEYEYKTYKPKTSKKIFKFLFKFSFRIALLGFVLYGFQNRNFVMDWVFKQSFNKILKNISPEVANLIKDNPMDIIKNPVTNIQIKAFAQGLELYKGVYGIYPDDFGAFLKNNFESRAGEKKDITVDTWGNSYRYVKTGKYYEITSAGPDGEFGTDDDISAGK